MAPLREEGIAAGRETVNKVCRVGKLCPCQHSMLVSPSFSTPPSPSHYLTTQRIKKRKKGVFRKQTEQTGASAWIQLDWEMIVQTELAALSHFSECAERTGAGLFFNCRNRPFKKRSVKRKKKNIASSSWYMYVNVHLDVRLTVWINTRVKLISQLLTPCSRTHTLTAVTLTDTEKTHLHFFFTLMMHCG